MIVSRFCTSASIRPVIGLSDCSRVFLTFRSYTLPKDGFQYVIVIINLMDCLARILRAQAETPEQR